MHWHIRPSFSLGIPLLTAFSFRSPFAVLAVTLACGLAGADQFGSGDNQFEIPFVTIGSPGNPADTTGDPNPAGRVDYVYRMGKYEVPEEAIVKANALSAAAGNPLNLNMRIQRGPQKPATTLTWFGAARFVNWLNEEVGATPAYKFDASGTFQLWESGDVGYDPDNRFRNTQAFYFLPSADEWYKAAFYDPVAEVYWDFPTGSDDPPIPVASGTVPGTAVYNQQVGPADVMFSGGPSPFGTVGQAGNVWEYEESPFDVLNFDPNGNRGLRGATWIHTNSTLGFSSAARASVRPFIRPFDSGFRIVSVPEPGIGSCISVFLLMGIASVRRGVKSEHGR